MVSRLRGTDGPSRPSVRRRTRPSARPRTFVPFLDVTSGNETYGAGRHLDVEAEWDGRYVLDFNLAYLPYCAYSPDFSCPLTPTENRLDIRIEAGERFALAR